MRSTVRWACDGTEHGPEFRDIGLLAGSRAQRCTSTTSWRESQLSGAALRLSDIRERRIGRGDDEPRSE